MVGPGTVPTCTMEKSAQSSQMKKRHQKASWNLLRGFDFLVPISRCSFT